VYRIRKTEKEAKAQQKGAVEPKKQNVGRCENLANQDYVFEQIMSQVQLQLPGYCVTLEILDL
jgi:hypothetical protein